MELYELKEEQEKVILVGVQTREMMIQKIL